MADTLCLQVDISTPVLALLKEVLVNHSEVSLPPLLNTGIGLHLSNKFNREVIMVGGERVF